LHIAYLTQEFEIPHRKERILDSFHTSQPGAGSGQVQREMETAGSEQLDRLIHQLDRLQRYFEALDGYGLEAQIEDIARNGI